MNKEQIMSAIRWFITTFGTVLATYVASRGIASADNIIDFLNSEFFIGGIASITMFVWSMFTHTKTNAVAIVDNMSDVAGVVTRNTPEGLALAKSIPSDTVVAASDPMALKIVKS